MVLKSQCDNSKGFCRQFAVATAPHFKGPYTVVRKIPVYGEDAGLWRDKKGSFHMLFHGGNYADCHSACNYTGPSCSHHGTVGSCYFHTAWSQDGLDWHMDKHTEPFNMTFALDGGQSVTYTDRARHEVLLDEDGDLVAVYGGVKEGQTDATLTAVQPVATAFAMHGQ